MSVVAVFGASAPAPGDRLYTTGVTCGRLLAERGFDVATGGYGGLMEAVSRGAREAGGHVIGVTAPPVFPGRDQANEWVTQELRAASLTERIHELTDIADAAIVLDGSIGTLTELMVAWNLAFVARFHGGDPLPLVTVGERWNEVVDYLCDVLDTDGSLVVKVAGVEEAVDHIAASVS
ncbi:MAG: LOG family protein [Acidimicrobiia bacterium]|nr:LOG family protein [Acidimicrobiia bacterium]MBT8214589.1 LOG family protein [Acidimicrobiia bacterium]NNC90866.1 LOG family protein [Acidimicrobiia bacterium]